MPYSAGTLARKENCYWLGILVAQVDRWQRTSGLEWSENDIKEVSRYLNGKYYHYP